MRSRFVALPLLATLTFLISNCGDGEDKVAGGCTGSVATATQVGNAVNITGSFGAGQPIMELSMNGTDHNFVSQSYSASTASFDITGFAKGQYTVTWILSCFNEDGEVTISSPVKTFTIS
ncbi:MAG TPA: hypothetical protein VGM20_13120 [Gemmatimonadales bacterium]